MRRFLVLFCVLVFPVLTQCSHDYDPDCSRYGPEHTDTDVVLVARAKQAWDILKDKKREGEWLQAGKDYNEALYTMIERYRCMEKGGTPVEKMNFPFVVHNSFTSRFPGSRVYERLIPADKIDIDHVQELVTVNGLGVPLIGVINREKGQQLQNQISDAEGVHTLTAIMDFDNMKGGKPVFRLIPRLQENFIKIGAQRHNLAGNFSAAIDYLWERSRMDDTKLLGLLRPSEGFDTMGLFFQEPYDPNKIPIVFTHGLQSSPATFADLSNRLMASPEIRKNYQFWFFGYPTGVSWVVTSARFRESIEQARTKFDPKHKDKTFDQMVLVGHSMGGLVTRYSVSEDPWGIIRYALKDEERSKLNASYVKERMGKHMDSDEMKRIMEMVDFQPLTCPQRVVFLATPHRGSDFADNWIARIGIALIELPQNILEETYRMVTLNSNILLLNPDRLVDSMTSIGQLSPENPMIMGLDPLRIDKKVPVHSVIGDRGKGDTPDSSDGFVKYKSSHLDWSVSEKIVPSGHSVQDNPQTATELHRILCIHAKKCRGSSAFRFTEGKPAPSISTPVDSGMDLEDFFDPKKGFLPVPE